MSRWPVSILGLLVLFLAACGQPLQPPAPATPELETQACTRSWPVVQRSSTYQSNAKVVQYLLRARGYGVTADGYFGTNTYNAVVAFQGSVGLTKDGIVGKNTWERLIITVQYGSRGEAVRAVQFKRGITNDGIFGSGTKSSVVNLQASKGLAQDGIVGPDTWAALVGSVNCGTATGTRAQLAQQILNNSRITLGTSSSTPGGNPRQNIIDTAAGRPAKSGCYDFSRCNSTVYLSTKMLQAMLQLAGSNSYYVTSLTGGRHSAGSDHYQGRGLDIGIWNGKTLSYPNSAHTAARNACISAGSYPGQTFNAYNDPSGHSDHVHCAFY